MDGQAEVVLVYPVCEGGAMRQSARPIVFIWLAIVLGAMMLYEQMEGFEAPVWAKSFIIAYLGEWLLERAWRKNKGAE